MENKTRTTIAAFPMVEATPVGSRMCQHEAHKSTAAESLTHGYDISNNGVAKSDVSSNGYQDVN